MSPVMSSSSSSGTLEQVDSAGQNREHVEEYGAALVKCAGGEK